MKIGEYEFNGGFRKAMIGVAITLATGLGAFVLKETSKVSPLVIEVQSAKEMIGEHKDRAVDRWDNQREWNDVFLAEQRELKAKMTVQDQKLDRILEAVKK